MAYTTPRTWVAEELVTATMMNAHVRDNISYLKNSPTFDGDVNILSGLVVGFASAPSADTVKVGDANFLLDFNSGTAPRTTFDSGDFNSYNRTSNFFDWQIASTLEMKLDASGLQIANGLVVGFAGTPADDCVQAGDANFELNPNSGLPKLTFDTGDLLRYTRSTNIWEFFIGGVQMSTFDANGIAITGGLLVGFAGTPTADQVKVGDANCLLDFDSGTAPRVTFDSGDMLRYDRSTNQFQWAVATVNYMLLTSATFQVNTDVIFSTSNTKNAVFFGTGSFGGGAGVVFVANRGTAPTSNPTGGGLMYAESGAGKWRGSSGTVTTFGPAEPHCPRCGRDSALEWQNDRHAWGLAVCVSCLVTALERAGIPGSDFLIHRT